MREIEPLMDHKNNTNFNVLHIYKYRIPKATNDGNTISLVIHTWIFKEVGYFVGS